MWALPFAGSQRCGADHVVIFVDVDGVLNVVVNDPGCCSVTLSTPRVNHARTTISKKARSSAAGSAGIEERLVSTDERTLGHGEDAEATFAKFAVTAHAMVSDVLVARLAAIIDAAGPNRTVVLSSSWRHYNSLVEDLEKLIGRHLDTPNFRFDDRTPLVADYSPQERLRVVADYFSAFCAKRSDTSKVRALIIDDFHSSALHGLRYGDFEVASIETAEQYVESRVPRGFKGTAFAKVLHTYETWTTDNGTKVAIGCGLKMQHVCEAFQFVSSRRCTGYKATPKCPREAEEGPSNTESQPSRRDRSASVTVKARSNWIVVAAVADHFLSVMPMSHQTVVSQTQWNARCVLAV